MAGYADGAAALALTPDAIRAHCELSDIRMLGNISPYAADPAKWYGLYLRNYGGEGSHLIKHYVFQPRVSSMYIAPQYPRGDAPWPETFIPDDHLLILYEYLVSHREYFA